MTIDLRQRLRRASDVAAQRGVDAMLVSPGADLRYLTGYHAKPLERLTCLVLPSDGAPVMVVPLLERASAEAFGVKDLGVEIVTWDETDDPYALAARHVPGDRPTIAFDNHMWAEKVLAFEAAMPDARAALAGDVLEELRMRKSEAEVDLLRDVAAAIDRVHARMGEWLRPGRTEHEVSADIAYAILEEGHISADFVIVGSGPNGASPHHDVSDRVIQPDEPVVVDIGGTSPAGYCSDSTRTYVTGEAPQEFTDYYAVLVEAQRAQCEYVRPGVTASSVDKVGRDIIDAAGYGDAFFHRTGHGIGMETHEAPYIVADSDLVLEAGMAFSIEPGIYLEGKHGARIEDIVVCTSQGAERLNTRPREAGVVDGGTKVSPWRKLTGR